MHEHYDNFVFTVRPDVLAIHTWNG